MILKRIWREDGDEKRLIELTLNPLVAFGIGRKSIGKKVDSPVVQMFPDLLSLCLYLESRDGITDEDIANVQYFLSTIPVPSLREFCASIITKQIRIGITSKTLNKLLGFEAVPKFSCMLANKYFDRPSVVEGKRFTITLKMDGIRCLCVKEDGRVTFYSRQGQVIRGMDDIEKEALSIRLDGKELKSFVLDGELLVENAFNMRSKDAYKQTTTLVRKDGKKFGVDYHVFDFLPLKDFVEQNSTRPYWDRRNTLEQIEQENRLSHLQIVPSLYRGSDTSEIISNLGKARENEQEGVMINLDDEPYQFKRTDALLKVKVMNDCDLTIVGVQEGSGKYKGTVGSIIVFYKGNRVGVGSGISDATRKEMWVFPERFVGRVATIQYFEETEDKDGKKSIRFPVFKELREVGKKVSYA